MTGAKKVHLLVFDGLADWEPAHALAELRRSGGHEVRTVGFDARPVTSMGGLRIEPDCALSDVRSDDMSIFILPGGDMWEGDYPAAPLEALLRELEGAAVPVAAICGATLAVARAGLLRGRRHTSNMPDYVSSMVPGYGDSSDFVDALAVRDRHVITASGLGSVDFAREIFAELAVFDTSDLATWYDLFKHGRFPQVAPQSGAP